MVATINLYIDASNADAAKCPEPLHAAANVSTTISDPDGANDKGDEEKK